jgi:Fis family transcriptional regulator
MVKRAVVMTRGSSLPSDSFSALLPGGGNREKGERHTIDVWVQTNLYDFVRKMVQANASGIRKIVLDRVEAPLIEMVLKEVGGNQIKASQLLGINRNTLRKKIKEYGIVVRGGKGPS